MTNTTAINNTNSNTTVKLRELIAAKTVCSSNAKYYTLKKAEVDQLIVNGVNVAANLKRRRELSQQLVKANYRLIEANSLYVGYSEALADILGVGAGALQG